MYYLTYLSKCRRGLNIDTEKEIQYNKNRYVTKAFESSMDYAGKMSHIGMPWYYGHTVRMPEISYMQFEIPKKSGGVRIIHAPNEELKALQKNLMKQFEECKILPHNAVHSFLPYRNCKTALQVHQKNHSRWFLKLDIQDYFTSITYDNMKKALIRIVNLGDNQDSWLPYCFYQGVLPQGAPTSPVLSNLYLLEFDYRLTEKLKELDKNFVYTRYADDILISNRNTFRFVDVVNVVKELLAEYSCTIKDRKTRYGSFNGSNWNLGIMYNNQFNLTVGYKAKHLIKNRVHNLFNKTWSEEAYTKELYHLRGLLAWYVYIEPDYFKPLMTKWHEAGYEI